MNNNNLDQVTIQSSKRKIERFNFKHSVDTSMGIGEIQVLQCNEVQPDSRYVTSVNSTVRLDPMVAPTAGELNLHHNFLFVGMSELYPKFPVFACQKACSVRSYDAGSSGSSEYQVEISLYALLDWS